MNDNEDQINNPIEDQINNPIEESQKENPNLNIKLQLGDIIQLDAPSNQDLNEKIYFIKFI